MLRLIIVIILIFTAVVRISAQEIPDDGGNVNELSAVKLPVNLYDAFKFSDENGPYVKTGLYFTAPAFFFMYGVSTWGWTAGGGFELNPETCFGPEAVNGAADKSGHLYAGYIVKRFTSFLFKASGSSGVRANIEGAILSELVTLGSEAGDGFSPDYGFDPYDVMFNNLGIIIGMMLDWSPVLDRMFAVQIEYIPTREMRRKFDIDGYHDLPTDYGGTKFILAAKLAGIPCISLTPFRYLNLDIGYYSRGYNQSDVDRNTRNIYLGISVNLSIAFGDLLPAGYTSSTIQSVFNYVHVPLDYEAYRYVISDAPKER